MTKRLAVIDDGNLDRPKLILGADTIKVKGSAALGESVRAADRGQHVSPAALMRLAAASDDLADDDALIRGDLLVHVLPVATPARAELPARALHTCRVRRSQHRGVSILDRVLAAIAGIERLVVLHYVHDVGLISEVTR